MKNKDIKILADKIIECERDINLGKNVKENQEKIEAIMLSLTFDDLFKLDNYISEKIN